jgi:hypothetical protein
MTAATLFWDLHTVQLQGRSNHTMITQRWRETFASLPAGKAPADLSLSLAMVETVPPPPDREPDFTQGQLLQYFVEEGQTIAHFPTYGQMILDFAAGTTRGQIVQAALDRYGVFEDLLAIGLSPHLRRRGLFLIHAFAAAYRGQAVLLIGGSGAGKTTTGMALLNQGWQLLSNDSPILNAAGQVLQYPGVLAAFPETLLRFEKTRPLAQDAPADQKILAAAETLWPGIWRPQAPIGAIIFPQIEDRAEHELEALTAPEALRRMLPHAVEQWDRTMIPAHLALLSELAQKSPAFVLHLGPEVDTIPGLLSKIFDESLTHMEG